MSNDRSGKKNFNKGGSRKPNPKKNNKPNPENDDKGIRLNKYIANSGMCSRRDKRIQKVKLEEFVNDY